MQLIPLRGPHAPMPTFAEFSERWVRDCTPQWKASYLETVQCTLRLWITPTFATWKIDQFDRAALLEYRAAVHGHERAPSEARVNKIMSVLGACLSEAGRRYGIPDPTAQLKPLRERRRDIQPFTLEEVSRIVLHARGMWRDYYTVRFYTGMRTAEIDGLQWRFVDFDRRQILVRETVVKGKVESTKTRSSEREIDMVPQVYDALVLQHRRTGERGRYVFCARNGSPLRHGNVRKRVWLPMLQELELEARRQYETRHTYATLMLAAGENPEYIRSQMGHSSAEMLFSVYSRYVPNLTRRDGSAFSSMIDSRQGGGQ